MGAVVLCLLLLVAMPDPRQSATSDHIPPKIGDGVESTASPLTTSTHSTSVQGLMSAISDRNIRLTIPVFLVGIFRYAMLNILIQYASVRFGLKISSGAIFYTETAFVNIFLFLFLIPHITSYVRLRFNVQPSVIDLFLVRTSVSLMCVGCLAIGLAQSNSLLPFGTIPPPPDHDFVPPARLTWQISKVFLFSRQVLEAGCRLSLLSHIGSLTTQKPRCMQRS